MMGASRSRFLGASLLGIWLSSANAQLPMITAPLPRSTLTGATETFAWSDGGSGANEYWLYLGASPGASNHADSGALGNATSFLTTALPQDGSLVNARLWYRVPGNSNWLSIDTPYFAANSGPVAFTFPASRSALAAVNQRVDWTGATSGANNFWLYVGSTPGRAEYFNSGNLGTVSSVVATGLPHDGSTVYARLWYRNAGHTTWRTIDTSYAAVDISDPTNLSPVPDSVLNAEVQRFDWAGNALGANEYWVYIGAAQGGSQYFNRSTGLASSVDASGLPSDGTPLYFRLWYRVPGDATWRFEDRTYTAATLASPAIVSPAPGTSLTGSSASFSWTDNGSSVQEWWLYAGTGAGLGNYHDSGSLGSATTAIVTGLPANETSVVISLWYRRNANWQSVSTTYVSSSGGTAGGGTQAVPTLPVADASGHVDFGITPQASSTSIVVTPYRQLPLASNGQPPRLNGMAGVSGRLFVLDEFDGHITDITTSTPELWFDVADAVSLATGRVLDTTNSFHGGLRSLAFHPNFAVNGRFYTSLMEQRPASTAGHRYLSDPASPIAADSVLVEWTADPVTLQVDVASYREFFRVGMPVYDHPIKQILFNPFAVAGSSDYGLLYIGHGDASVASAIAGGGMNNDALGKILRIDPLQDGSNPYKVPASNPFAGSTSMIPEAFSIGHRNPHHLAFSSAGDLVVAEPGRDNIEEVNLVTAGGNFGWPEREGPFRHLVSGGVLSGIDALPANDVGLGYTYPALILPHDGQVGATSTGVSIGGGYVVTDGSVIDGHYLATDFVSTGTIYHAPLTAMKAAVTRGSPQSLSFARMYRANLLFDHDANPATPALPRSSMIEIVQASPGYDGSGRVDVRFGRDAAGVIYLMSKRNRQVYRLSVQ